MSDLVLSKLFDDQSHSKLYHNRPGYSPEIARGIVQFWHKFNIDSKIDNLKIVDMGCGTGQLTKLLIPYAELLVGIDCSESQIKEAKAFEVKKDFPKYIVGSSDHIPFPDNSLDLITAALCIHWFDIDKFYAEVDRCLKENGVLAIINYCSGYFVANIDENTINELNEFVNSLYTDDKYLGPYFCEEGRKSWRNLKQLQFLYPSTGVRDNSLEFEFTPTLRKYGDFFRSTSMYQTWRKCNPNEIDMAETILEKILFYLGNPSTGLDTILVIKYPVRMIMCSKPHQEAL